MRARVVMLVYWVCLGGVVGWAGGAEANPDPDLAPPSGLSIELNSEEQFLFRNLTSKLRCPTCTGLSVADSDAAFSKQIQGIVKEQVKAGKSEAEILEFFTGRYGNWILREPPKKGFSLLAWLFPIALMLLGPLVVWLLVWRRRGEVPTFGLRSPEALVAEFEEALFELKQRGPPAGAK